MVRLYFNRRGAEPWSIDHGRGTPEKTYPAVAFHGANGTTVFDPEAGDNRDTPTAWFAFINGEVAESGTGAIIREKKK